MSIKLKSLFTFWPNKSPIELRIHPSNNRQMETAESRVEHKTSITLAGPVEKNFD